MDSDIVRIELQDEERTSPENKKGKDTLQTRKEIIMTNGYNYDALTNTLTISASFAKKASKVGSLEYNIILKLRHDFPNLTIQQEAKKEGKKGLTFGQMEDFIAQHRDADEIGRASCRERV